MAKNFLISTSETTQVPSGQELTNEPLPERESLRLLVIGSRNGVSRTIQTLHRLRFAEVREWSPLMPGPNPGEVMSILTRYIRLD